jgi:MoaD family protein
MKLRVHYMAQLRDALGRTEEDVEMPEGSTLAELLVRLAAGRDREVERHLITDAGQPRPSLLVVVNDAPVSPREAVATALRPGDVVTLLPPIAGG